MVFAFKANAKKFHLFRNSVTIHNRNMQQRVTEIFKVNMGISPIVMKEIFNFSDDNNYNLRSGTHLSRPIVHTAHCGTT